MYLFIYTIGNHFYRQTDDHDDEEQWYDTGKQLEIISSQIMP